MKIILLYLFIIYGFMQSVAAPALPAGAPVHQPEPVILFWQPVRTITDTTGNQEGILLFDGHGHDNRFGLLPLFNRMIPMPDGHDSVADVSVTSQIWQPVTTEASLRLRNTELIPGTLFVEKQTVTVRKTDFAQITILPLRINPLTGIPEQLLSFSLAIVTIPSAKSNKPVASYAENSVLASGRWFKLATPTEGIYRITYQDLASFGLDPGSIDPKNLRLYGNGGGMLPEANASPRMDDLMENAILVVGEQDGRFDPQDYILFFGHSPDKWEYLETDKVYRFRKNIYSDRAHYFLTADAGPGKRITVAVPPSGQPQTIAETFDDYAAYEKEEVNLIKSGRQWWDKQYFDLTTSRNFIFDFENLVLTKPVFLYTHLAARSTVGRTSFTISLLGTTIKNVEIDPITGSYDSDFAKETYASVAFIPPSPSLDIRFQYNKSSSSSVGYLDFIHLNVTRMLRMRGHQMLFRTMNGVKQGGITEFRLSGAPAGMKIWDVTSGDQIREIPYTMNGEVAVFTMETESLKEFCALTGQSYLVPDLLGSVPNQNLHGMPVPDYLIIAPPAFMTPAQRLADFHTSNSGLTVSITNPELIYNEFSSGSQDVTAIRDFVRMLYKKAAPGKEPRYLLLFGDASYDYKNRTQNNTNIIPSFQSVASLSPISSFVSDDYFGMLDDNEGQAANGKLDIGIGRFPVFTVEQATQAVDKVLYYCSGDERVKNDWRNVVTFVADDQNEGGNLFVEDSEDLSKIIEKDYPHYNVDKIYSDAYNMISTPGGARYPEVNEAISKRMEKGSLLMNYVGHGGELGWGHERILEVPDIIRYSNKDRMPVFVTATCEFSRFDDPERVSAGEWVFLNPEGGGVALFTTSRLTFAGTNKSLLVNFYQQVFRQQSGKYMKMGDLLVASKTGMSSSPNIHAFVLLGDPAMQMAYPDLEVVTTSISEGTAASPTDTLQALAEITISGEIRDADGNMVPQFNGVVFPTVFDKASEIWTKANQKVGSPVQFFLRKNPVYKGTAEVKGGKFSFTFIVPKDISYQLGPGKISYYARSIDTDANGSGTVYVGGFNNKAQPDDQGPDIELFMNSRNFRSGGITNQDPLLIADVRDPAGINTVGNGIGHDITAILDEKSNNPIILNDYYLADLNTYKSGVITYPMSKLADGPHTLTVKVWDVYNNSTVKTIHFTVVSTDEFVVEKLFNYPNPMTSHTTFSWETNQVNMATEAEISIYSMTGELVCMLKENFHSTGFRRNSIQWDGNSHSGGKVGSGIYIVRLRLELSNGSTVRKSSKMVVIR